tara:strand:- start:2369 stop:3124 length:756 start_codon:yes stop_codon:yes gene_type:complete
MDAFAGYTVVGFDTETTGLDPRRDRIVQYAFVGADVSGEKILITSIVDPGVSIPEASTNVHGIRNSDVEGSLMFDEHTRNISELVEDSVIIGHNVRKFDWRFVEMEYMRCGEIVPRPAYLLDTLELARALKISGRHTLGALCKKYGIILERAHSADADAAATLILMWKMIKHNPGLIEGGIDSLAKLCGGVSQRIGNVKKGEGQVITFGKYSGSTFASIISSDPKYAFWLMSNSSPLSDEDRAILEKIVLD